MKKKILMPVIAGLFLFLCAITAWGGEIILDAAIKEKAAKMADETKSIIYVDKGGVEQTQVLFKKWISQSMDLSAAKARESAVFNRVSYLQEITDKENILYLDGSLQTVKPAEPVTQLYSEGPLYFRWAKLKEFYSKVELDVKYFAEAGRKLLLGSKFIIESKEDRIGNYELMSSAFSEDADDKEGLKSVEYLSQQDLAFYRSFRGKPVFNSIALVGINPDNREIVELNLYDWIPLDEQLEIKLTSAELDKTGAATAGQLLERIYSVVKESADLNEKTAVVKDIVSGYFQTNENLVSVMGIAFDVVYKDDDGSEQVDEYFEAINLTGSDDIFLKDYREKRIDEAPPK